MEDRIYRFEHGGIHGASIQVMEPAQWDLNRMLPDHLQLPEDSIVTYTHACCLLTIHGKQIMVDAGYHANRIVHSLSDLSANPEDIELILITHGDGDHIAGLIAENGELTYPQAHYVLHQELWDYWHSARIRSEQSDEAVAFFESLSALIESRASMMSVECEIEPGITFIPCLGHRHGHSVYEFQTSATPILHSGDSFFHPLFLAHPDWPDTMALDAKSEVASRKRLLKRAACSGALILTGHMPFPGMGTVHQQEDGYRWTPMSTSDIEAGKLTTDNKEKL